MPLRGIPMDGLNVFTLISEKKKELFLVHGQISPLEEACAAC